MSKIDIAIKVTNNGAGEPIVINGGEWTRFIIDVRQILEKLSGMEDDRKVARMLSFTDDGSLITLMHLLNSGRGSDNVSAWIHIPSCADIGGHEVITIMKIVQDVIQAPELDKEPLIKLCQVDYPERPAVSKSSTGKEFAMRYYDDDSLMTILGPKRYQPYYDNYRYIFLLDKNDTIRVANGEVVTDLTEKTLGKYLSILPRPAAEVRRHFGYDLKVLLPDGTPFDHPQEVEKDGYVTLQLVRNGFKPVAYKARQESPDSAPWKLPNLNNIHWMMDVKRSMFALIDDQGKALLSSSPVTIKINGKTLGQNNIEMREDACHQVSVKVSAGDDYEPWEGNIDLTEWPLQKIMLKRKTKQWERTVVMKNNETAEMILSSKHIPKSKSGPLKGYEIDEETGHLVFDDMRVWLHRAQGFLTAVGAALLCWGIVWLYGKIFNEKNNEGQQQQEEILKDNEDSTFDPYPRKLDEYQEIINYLENNESWVKDSLDKINGYAFEGLFDDLNSYDFESIKANWAPKLERSTTFMSIVNLIDKCLKNGIKNLPGKYCEDGKITINRYINKLNKSIENNRTTSTVSTSITSPAPGKKDGGSVSNNNNSQGGSTQVGSGTEGSAESSSMDKYVL